MKINKKILAAVIIFGSLIIAVSIIIFNNPSRKESAAANLQEQNNPLLQFNRQNPTLTAEQKLAVAVSAAGSGNLTDAFAKLYFQEMVKQNPDNFQPDQKGLKLPTDISNLALPEDQVAQLTDQSFQIAPFEIKDIKTTNDNSTQAQLAYVKALQEINEKNFSRIENNIFDIANQWLFEQKKEPLQTIVKIIPGQIKDLLNLTVPSLWQEFHLQNLNLWQKKLVAYSALLGSEQDPLKSMMAMQQVSPLLKENLGLDKILQQKFIELSKKS